MQALRDTLAASATPQRKRSLEDLLRESARRSKLVALSDSDDLDSISDVESIEDCVKQPDRRATKKPVEPLMLAHAGKDKPQIETVRAAHRNEHEPFPSASEEQQPKCPEVINLVDSDDDDDDISAQDNLQIDTAIDEDEGFSGEDDQASRFATSSASNRDDYLPIIPVPPPAPILPAPVIAEDLEFDDALDAYGTEPKSHRLWPSLAGFNRLVTRWQPDRTAVPRRPLPEPPIFGNFPISAGNSTIPLRFGSHDDHRRIFAPWLLKECLTGLQNREDRDRTAKEKQHCGWRRGSLVSAMLWKDPKKDRAVPMNAGALHVLSVELDDRSEHDDEKEYADLVHGDLVMLSCSAWDQNVNALAVVQGWDPDLDLLHLNTEVVTSERVYLSVCVHANRAKEAAQGGWLIWSQIEAASIRNTALWMCSIGSVLTFAREFQALSSLPYIQPTLRNNALLGQPRPRAMPEHRSKYSMPPACVSAQLWRRLLDTYNSSQIRAIWEIASGNAFDVTLLQGPPGTGKTRTILGILSVLLAGAIPDANGTASRQSAAAPSVRITVGATLQATNSRYSKPAGRRDSNSDFIDISTTRILVCAPSNTAVDEIVYRLRTQGVFGQNGKRWFPEVVRIGVPGGRFRQSQSSRHSLGGPVRTSGGRALPEIVQRTWLDSIVEERRKISRDHVSQIRKEVLRSAHVVCATLSGSGSQSLLEVLLQATAGSTNRSVQGSASRMEEIFTGFDAVVIDEAAQAVEPSALIPFKFNPRTAVLVGDPAQLPATLRAPEADKAGYGQSLFERLQRAGHPLQMLDLQYRMHPDICEFASRRFYSGLLRNAREVTAGSRRKSFHRERAFRPFVFHNLTYSCQQRGSARDGATSYENPAEVHYAMRLYKTIREQYGDEDLSFGIIAPYNQQIRAMREQFKLKFPGVLQHSHSANRVEISTVDGYQGREMDVIIFSCVRAPESFNGRQQATASGRGIGFLSEWRRLNVAITRAKYGLWMIGHADTLQQDDHWRELIRDARDRNVLITVKSPQDCPWGVRLDRPHSSRADHYTPRSPRDRSPRRDHPGRDSLAPRSPRSSRDSRDRSHRRNPSKKRKNKPYYKSEYNPKKPKA